MGLPVWSGKRTVGPEGSAGGEKKKNSVQIHILQRGAQARQQGEMEEKD